MTPSLRGFRDTTAASADPRLRVVLNAWLALGVLAVAVLPSARGDSTWLGWMPLWLVLMPASACWALHRFRLPRWRGAEADQPQRHQRRRRQAQARMVRRKEISRRGWSQVA